MSTHPTSIPCEGELPTSPFHALTRQLTAGQWLRIIPPLEREVPTGTFYLGGTL